jgi:hypothetical protein
MSRPIPPCGWPGRAPLIAAARARGGKLVGYSLDATREGAPGSELGARGQGAFPDAAIHISCARLKPPARDQGFDALFVVQAERASSISTTARSDAALRRRVAKRGLGFHPAPLDRTDGGRGSAAAQNLS